MRYYDLIEQHIQKFIEKQDECLREPIRLALTGGKRLRPILMMAWREVDGGDAQEVLDLALSIELVHTMSCIHDDIIDRSTYRHGELTVWAKYGESVAIIVGDVLLAQALAMLDCVERRIIGAATVQMAVGQVEEVQGSEEWENIHRGKTAALIGAACKIGALFDWEYAEQWGVNLGIAYQIMDDLKDDDGMAAKSRTVAEDTARRYLSLCEVHGDGEPHKILRQIVEKVSE